MKYASIDGEMTGLDVKRCELIEIAVVVEDTAAFPLPPVEELPHLVLRAWPATAACWEPGAYEMHKKSGLLEDLTNSAASRSWFFEQLKNFLYEHFVGNKFVVAGKNFNGFDKRFFENDACPLAQVIAKQMHHRVLDPGSMFVDWTQEAPLALSDLLKRFGLADSVSHRALDDARDVIRVLRQSYTKTVWGAVLPASAETGSKRS